MKKIDTSSTQFNIISEQPQTQSNQNHAKLLIRKNNKR